MDNPGEMQQIHYDRPRLPGKRLFIVALLGIIIAGLDYIILNKYALDTLSVVFLGIALVSFYILVSLVLLRRVFSDHTQLPKIEIIEHKPTEGMQWEPTPSEQSPTEEEKPLVLKEMEGTPADKSLMVQSKSVTKKKETKKNVSKKSKKPIKAKAKSRAR